LLGWLRPAWIIFGTTQAAPGVPRPRSIPTTTILPGVDLEGSRNGNGPRARRELGIPDDAPIVAAFGRVDPFKSQLNFVKAMGRVKQAHPNVRGVICGWEDDAAYSQRVRDMRAKLGLEDDVILTGFVPDGLKDDILAAADVVVHVAQREPFGLVVAEAMAAGKPIVATAATGPRSLIRDGVTGLLVPVGAVPEIAAAIVRLLDHPDERASLGSHAAEAAQDHSIDRMVQRIEEVWDAVVTERSAGSNRP
jgi:glycosyltransferase involved in cell wall biosynthesis